ncbi:hypothetical protein LPB136_13475 [Tenacibaculum todarodis]|uniref:Uncharacterized protein n=1 Tax=Tenacibaculum todarodis TaxID=1850252 RepID=A0A1L3JMG9_9FLAO|nr:hypothetical protein [Tenacibaculum todarodis]APG66321.1 hypothetical protein LPB136_13475 [Tenacibaculum todarodis]
MNYGEKFVQIYNENIERIIKTAITEFKDYYETNNSFKKAERRVAEPLISEIRSFQEKVGFNCDIFQTSHEYLQHQRANYNYDITISIVNDEIKKEVFDKNKENCEITSYSDYIVYFAKRESIRDYFNYIFNNRDEINKKFKSKKMDEAFLFISNKREIHAFKGFDKKEKLKKESSFGLTQNEKMILLHVLLHKMNNSGLYNLSREYFRVLALCSECLVESDLYNVGTNYTKFNYFNIGIDQSTKTSREKAKFIDEIQNKIIRLKNIPHFKKALNNYKNSL